MASAGSAMLEAPRLWHGAPGEQDGPDRGSSAPAGLGSRAWLNSLLRNFEKGFFMPGRIEIPLGRACYTGLSGQAKVFYGDAFGFVGAECNFKIPIAGQVKIGVMVGFLGKLRDLPDRGDNAHEVFHFAFNRDGFFFGKVVPARQGFEA